MKHMKMNLMHESENVNLNHAGKVLGGLKKGFKEVYIECSVLKFSNSLCS